jgi:hypothetical protein
MEHSAIRDRSRISHRSMRATSPCVARRAPCCLVNHRASNIPPCRNSDFSYEKLGLNTPREGGGVSASRNVYWRMAMSPLAPSLRAQRSNPESFRGGMRDTGLLRCARNDAEVAVRLSSLFCPDAAQRPGDAKHRPVRCAAEPGPVSPHRTVPPLGPGSGLHAAARPGHVRPAPRSVHLTIFWRCSCGHFSSRNDALGLPATNRQRF